MKKLLWIFALLAAAAFLATVTGALLARRGGMGAGDATVLVWRVAGYGDLLPRSVVRSQLRWRRPRDRQAPQD